MEFIALTFDVVGKVLIGWAALRVHHRVLYEHKIDAQVFRTMKFEQRLGILGIALIIIAYFIKIV